MPGFSMGQMGFSTRPREMTDGAAEKRDRKLPQPPVATPWDRMDAQQQARLNPMAAAESRDLAAATAPPESTYESYMAEKGLPEQQDIFSILSKPQVELGGGVRRYGSVPGSADGANQRKAIQNAPRYEEYLQRDPKVQTYRQKLEDAYNELESMGPMDNLFKGKVQRQKIQALQSNYELALNDAKMRLADADSTYKASLPKYDIVNVGGGQRMYKSLPNQMPEEVSVLAHPNVQYTEDTPEGTFTREQLPDGRTVSTRMQSPAEKSAAELRDYGAKAKINADQQIRVAGEFNKAGFDRNGKPIAPAGSVNKSELLEMYDANGGENQNFQKYVERDVAARLRTYPQVETWDAEGLAKKKAEEDRLRAEIAANYRAAKRELDASQGGGTVKVRADGTTQRLANGTTFVFEPDPKPAPKKK